MDYLHANEEREVFSELPKEEQSMRVRSDTFLLTEQKRKDRKMVLRLRQLESDRSIDANTIKERYLKPVQAAGDDLEYTQKVNAEKQKNRNVRLNTASYRFYEKYKQSQTELLELVNQGEELLEIRRPIVQPEVHEEENQNENIDNEEFGEEFIEDEVNEEEIIEEEEEPKFSEQEIQKRKKAVARLDSFLKKDDPDYNKKLLEDYLGNKGAFRRFFFEKVKEVLDYDFSPRMLNISWLAENGVTVLQMISNVRNLKAIAESREYFPDGENKEKTLFDIKYNQAKTLLDGIRRVLLAGGIRLDTDEYNGIEIIQNVLTEMPGPEQNRLEESKRKIDEWQEKEITFIRQTEDNIDEKEEKRKKAFKPSEEVGALTLSDFIGAIGKKNRGQVVLAGGRLTIINNGFFKRKKTGNEAPENLAVKLQFIEKALDLVENDLREVYRPYLMGLVGLTGNETTSKPLTRKQIVAVMQELKDQDSSYKKILMTQGNNRLKLHALKVHNLFGDVPGEHDTSAVKKRKTEAIKREIRELIRRTNPDLRISEKRLDRLVSEHLDLLKDEIYRNARTIELAVSNMNGNAENIITQDDALWDRLASDAVITLAAATENANMIASFRTSETIRNEIISRSGKPEIGVMLDKLCVQNFYIDASKGYGESVLAHREKLFDIEFDKQLAYDLDAFFIMMEKAAFVAEFNRSLLVRGAEQMDLDKEAAFEAAATVRLLIAEKRVNFDKIADVLGDSDFVDGYRALVQNADDGFDFEETEKQLIQNLSAQHEKMEEVREERVLAIRRMNPEEEAIYESLNAEQKAACDCLLLRKGMSEYIKDQNDETVGMTVSLLETLRKLPRNEAKFLPVKLGNTILRLEQNHVGELFVYFGKKRLRLPTQAEGLIDHLERDMCLNVLKYGKNVVKEHIINKMDLHQDAYKNSDFTWLGKIAKDRDMAVRIIVSVLQDDYEKDTQKYLENPELERDDADKIQATIKAMQANAKCPIFENMPTDNLVNWAKRLVEAQDPNELRDVAKDVATQFFLSMAKKNMYGKETHALVSKLQEAHQDVIPVRIMYENRIIDEEEDGDHWTLEERKVKDFLADLVFGPVEPQEEGSSEKIVLEAFKKDYEGLQLILQSENYEILDRVVNKMSIPESEQGEGFMNGFLNAIKENLRQADEKLHLMGLSKRDFEERMRNVEFREEFAAFATRTDMGIRIGVDTAKFTIQLEISKAANAIFKNEPVEDNPINLQSLTERHISDAEKRRRLAEHNRELNRRIALEAKGDKGAGALTKEILSNYFNKSDIIERRYMMASLIRHSTPKRVLAPDASEEDKQKELQRRRGNMLGGILKGAGPLMQKIMQGMPEQGLPRELRQAIGDMKSNLLPIPDEIVKARLTSMIQRSRGLVTKIDVTRSLGAASVGQAFLCKLYGPNLPEEGEEVVIKLLRPDVINRMNREKDIMQDCADRVDRRMNKNLRQGEKGAINKTAEGQMKAIFDELDLNIEATKANLGAVYNNGDHHVKSVSVSKLIMPNSNTLMLEKAAGTTVDRYIKDVNELRKSVMEQYYVREGNAVVMNPETGRPQLSIEDKKNTVTESLNRLDEILTRLEKRQRYLATVAEKWVEEGVFGEGFYHGDLHAGNIMIDDNGATIIDFGNATKLTEKQKASMTKLTAAAAAGDDDYLLDAFGELLPDESKQLFRNKKQALRREVRAALAIGNKESTGLRISLILLKAQSLGIEVPAAIQNFSQSQIRLQNTLDEVNQMIEDLREDMAALAPHEEVVQQRHAHNHRPRQFFTVMSQVLERNIATSLKRLSFFKALSYKRKLAN